MAQKIYALLVGINVYPGDNQLRGCVNDVEAMEKYLRENYTDKNGFETKLETLLNNAATRDGVINAFKNVFGEAKDEDVCLFYYSGHGDQFKTPEEIQSQDEYCQTLVCYIDGERGDIADKEMGALINEVTKGKEVHFVAITDCCHSGTNFRDFITVRSFDNKSSGEEFNHIAVQKYVGFEFAEKIDGKYIFPQATYIHIASCRDDQKSIEKRIGPRFRGVFTYSLLDILTQKAGYINYESLTEQVKVAIQKHTSSQKPVLNTSTRENLLGQRQFLNNSKVITGNEPVIYFSNGSWNLNKGSLHGISTGDIIRLNENGLQNSYDAKVKIADMDNAVLEVNNAALKTNVNRDKNSLPVTIEFLNIDTMQLVIDNTAVGFKEALNQSPQLQKLEFVEITDGEPDEYYIGYDEAGKRLYLGNTGFDEPVFFSSKNITSAAAIDLFIDNIDKYSRARYFTHFSGKSNGKLAGKFEVKLFLQQEVAHSFTEIETNGGEIKIVIKDARVNAAKIKIQVVNTGEDILYIRSAYTDACYGIQTDLHQELELQPGQSKYLEVKNAATDKTITELFFEGQLLNCGITCIQEQLKLFIADATFGINGFAQKGISSDACRPNGSKGNTFRASGYNWVVENFNFEIEAV